jgi:plastocyanin
MTKARALFACAVACGLMMAGPTAAISQEARSPQAIAKVKIIDFAFQPSTITVPRGTMVGWKNLGTVSHTTTSDDGRWNSGPLMPGQIFGVRFRVAGSYSYHCEIHPSMTGTVVVT